VRNSERKERERKEAKRKMTLIRKIKQRKEYDDHSVIN